MHVIVRQGDGKYYVSAVFGIYRGTNPDNNEEDDFFDTDKSAYYIILNEEKTALIRRYYSDYSINFGVKTLLEIEGSQEGWILDKRELGGVDFLPKALALKITDEGVTPSDILERCLEIDRSFCYEELREIRSEADVNSLASATDSLYEAKLKAFVALKDDSYYALFDGCWGCDIEMWFEGNVNFNLKSGISQPNSKWWGVKLGIHNGMIFASDGFGDENDIFDEDPLMDDYRKSSYRWIMAERVRYRIIPL